MAESFLLGVLGGMGPLATLDFQHRLLTVTPADSDQQQLPHIVWNVPQIADRQNALAGTGPSPLPQLLHGIAKLNQAGATHIAIACNTAHHWYDDLAAASRAPILHIVDATIEKTASDTEPVKRVGLIATKGTLDAGWYQRGFALQGIDTIQPSSYELETLFVPGCYAVKRGELAQGGRLLSALANALTEQGAQKIILACTEVPVALRAIHSPFLALSIDPAQALAERCSKIWLACRHYYSE